MKTINLGKSSLQVPVVAVGCMRLEQLDIHEAKRFIRAALDLGANFFDHASTYGNGYCEEVFGDAISELGIARDSLILQSKCGIIRGVMLNFSKEFILDRVDTSLKRLKTDYLDVLLLHRPDVLVEPEEVAEAFDKLYASGKVRNFGVSNQNPMLMQLLQKSLSQPIVANQMQFSIAHATMVSAGHHVNTLTDFAIDRDGSALDYCRLNDITVQAWSPFQFGNIEGTFLGNESYPELNAKIDEIAAKYAVSNTTIALAWILRHPARMQAVVGTMNAARLKDCVRAADIYLTREEWYEIYLAAGNTLF